jgi:type II restriction/modification system DNA methylase subunit YeeA
VGELTPETFIAKWRASTRTEKSAAQEHFLDLCDLLEVPKPGDVDSTGATYTFEKHVAKASGEAGYADVWKRGAFAWEYKGDRKNLVRAYSQLKDYADALENPPLLIVSDMKEIRVHTNFTNTVKAEHVIQLADLNDPTVLRQLRWVFDDPERLRPQATREAVTAQAAVAFGTIARRLAGLGYDERRIAHFLNKLVFCLFVEDIELLPDRLFADIIEEGLKDSDAFTAMLGDLFAAMRHGNRRFGTVLVPWFNGGLFDDDDVLPLGHLEIRGLAEATRLDWSAIEPSVFGTLFEQALSPEKRKAMAGLLARQATDKGVGVHYTDPATIMKILEPVVLRPLRREWELVKAEVATAREKKVTARSDAARTRAEQRARDLYLAFRQRLGSFRVLDPACGSGNFLYLSLLHLKDFDLAVMDEARTLGLPLDGERVTPEAVRGIEINDYAAELARVTIWIGELQWQMRKGGRLNRTPILGQLRGIERRDALLNDDGSEAAWPEANVVIGNPPFLGDKAMLRQLGREYVGKLRHAYEGRVPGGADLVCYWFEKAWTAMAAGRISGAGLVATNSIRGGANRAVLNRIASTGQIFDAWSDEPWVIEGAAVRVSLVCFTSKDGVVVNTQLNGRAVSSVFADLTSGSTDLTRVHALGNNEGVAFIGNQKGGAFDIAGSTARSFLLLPQNPNGMNNSRVVRPWINGLDIVRRPRDYWIIDFTGMSEPDAALYEAPFQHILEKVRKYRIEDAHESSKSTWWLHQRPRFAFRTAMICRAKYVATARNAKFRLFVWADSIVVPDSQVVAIARDDDTTFGILHSRFHELWSLRLCTWLGVGNDPRYTPTTTFETFPFPEGLTPNIPASNYANDPRAITIAEAAKRLNDSREAWLNPADLVRREPEVVAGFPDRILPVNAKAAAELKKRTLTNLYNQRPTWLVDAHRALDQAVAAAYGWPADLGDDAVLERLLALNLARAANEARE